MRKKVTWNFWNICLSEKQSCTFGWQRIPNWITTRKASKNSGETSSATNSFSRIMCPVLLMGSHLKERHIHYNAMLDYLDKQVENGTAFVIRPKKKSAVSMRKPVSLVSTTTFFWFPSFMDFAIGTESDIPPSRYTPSPILTLRDTSGMELEARTARISSCISFIRRLHGTFGIFV